MACSLARFLLGTQSVPEVRSHAERGNERTPTSPALARGISTESRFMNGFLAVVWLLVGVGLIVYHATTGDPTFTFPLADHRVSVGWVALVLAIYNLARAWALRSYRLEEWTRQMAQLSRDRDRRWEDRRKPPSDPDPNFNFTDDPPRH